MKVENDLLKNEKINFEKTIEKKLFTKSQTNNIISKKYNPLSKDNKNYEREGLFMRETEDIVLNKKMKELIICKEDFKNYFKGRKIIDRKEYQKYLKDKMYLHNKK